MRPSIRLLGGRLHLRSSYDTDLVERLKAIAGRRWLASERIWSFPADELTACQLVEACAGDADLDVATTALVVSARRRELVAEQRKAGSVPVPPDYPWPAGMPPYGHQRAVAGVLHHAKEYALLWEMGTGKTYSAACDIRHHIDRRDVAAVLIVAPVSLLDMWRQELLRIAGIDATIVAGTASKRERMRSEARHCIVGYESLRVDRERWEVWASRWRRELIMVCDESTRIKTPRAAQTKAVIAVGRLAGWRRIMTGTPVTQSPLDAYSQFGFLSPAILGFGSFAAFRSRYAVMGGYQDHEVIDYDHLDELSATIADYSSRVLKRDCLDLPPKVYTTRHVTLGDDARRDYARLLEECVLEVEGEWVSAAHCLTRILRLSMIAGGFLAQDGQTLLRYDPSPKLRELEQVVAEVGDQKVIVWCRFVEEIRLVEQLLGRLGLDPVTFHGEVSPLGRAIRVTRFQEDPVCRAFIGQIHTGGVGLTLTAASVVVYYSHSYSLEDRLQSEDRAHRIGQTRSVLYVDLIARGTVDVAIARALREKKGLADLITRDSLRETLMGTEVK